LDFELAYRRLVEAPPLQSLQVAQAVAREFGDSLLTAEFIPDEHVDFICRLLLDPVVAKRPGFNELILALYIDREKLSASQLERFFSCLANSFGHLADENSALVTGDFIARVASPERALELLLDMTAMATSLQALAGVFLVWISFENISLGCRSMALSRPAKRPEPRDIRKPFCGFARHERQDRGRDFALDQPLDRAGFCFAELDLRGACRHQCGADAAARGGLLLLDRDVLVVQVG
jgi:hypothetical protein